MADLALALDAALRRAVAQAFPEAADADPVVRPSNDPRFGDYQANGAMGLGKRLGRPPREVAQAVAAHLDAEAAGVEPPEVAGPGFLNLRLTPAWLSARLDELAADPRLGIAPAARPHRLVVDYSAPNVAKEMHVGHLRSTIIGDALVRILAFLGHDVVRQNHIGDWGTPFGMLIEHLLDLGEAQAADELSVGDLTAFYQEARQKFDGGVFDTADGTPGFADRARNRVVLLQAGDAETLRLWHLLVEESKRYFNLVYRRLGVLLTDDDLAGESFYNDRLGPTCDDLEARGIAVVSQGALCVFPPGFEGRDGGPMPLMVKKSDGGFGYDATDLAALRYRTADLRATRLIYVVGSPQAQHLALVFAGATLAGWLGDGREAVHVAFGSVLGTDGKMLKTRSGASAKLIDLLDEAVERAAAIVAERSELSAEEQAAVAEAVGIGGVKYADLSNDRIKDYTFDYDRMLATDGNTGAYLQYAVARCHSILRKGAAEGAAPGAVALAEPAERALALALLRLDGAVAAAAAALAPHKLSGHLFDLAQAFTSFYDTCPVLKADDPTRASRLALCHLTAAALTLGLDLLGIHAPERM
ncbi:MAG TPA: arginine--tRNA ligase [Acidimicrobiales bacterium]|nr:arginine--tRNA ligase [Acidimicrobiales bacterium]